MRVKHPSLSILIKAVANTLPNPSVSDWSISSFNGYVQILKPCFLNYLKEHLHYSKLPKQTFDTFVWEQFKYKLGSINNA